MPLRAQISFSHKKMLKCYSCHKFVGLFLTYCLLQFEYDVSYDSVVFKMHYSELNKVPVCVCFCFKNRKVVVYLFILIAEKYIFTMRSISIKNKDPAQTKVLENWIVVSSYQVRFIELESSSSSVLFHLHFFYLEK